MLSPLAGRGGGRGLPSPCAGGELEAGEGVGVGTEEGGAGLRHVGVEIRVGKSSPSPRPYAKRNPVRKDK